MTTNSLIKRHYSRRATRFVKYHDIMSNQGKKYLHSSVQWENVMWRNVSSPDSKVHGANMGPIWGRQDRGGPHVGPINLAIWVIATMMHHHVKILRSNQKKVQLVDYIVHSLRRKGVVLKLVRGWVIKSQFHMNVVTFYTCPQFNPGVGKPYKKRWLRCMYNLGTIPNPHLYRG